MFDRFDLWQYRDDNNCWDFVREYLIDKAGISSEDLPKFGICPSNKRAMTKAAIAVRRGFVECGPVQYAVACQYHGKVLDHVGIVDAGKVRHVGKTHGHKRDKIDLFQRFWIHSSLWQQ